MQLNFISIVQLEEYLFDHLSSRNENTKRLTVSRKYIFDAYFTRINTSSIPSTFQQVSLEKLHVKKFNTLPAVSIHGFDIHFHSTGRHTTAPYLLQRVQ